MMYLGQDAIGLNHTLPVIGQVALLESGTYTPVEDVKASSIDIPHSLGVIPDFIVVMADPFSAESTMTNVYESVSFWCRTKLICSNRTTDGMMFDVATSPNSTNQAPRYWPENETTFCTATTFKIPRYNTDFMLKGGITYHYVIGKFNEQEVTANV